MSAPDRRYVYQRTTLAGERRPLERDPGDWLEICPRRVRRELSYALITIAGFAAVCVFVLCVAALLNR